MAWPTMFSQISTRLEHCRHARLTRKRPLFPVIPRVLGAGMLELCLAERPFGDLRYVLTSVYSLAPFSGLLLLPKETAGTVNHPRAGQFPMSWSHPSSYFHVICE